MKVIKIVLKSLILLILVSSCRDPSIEIADDITEVIDVIDKKLWILQNKRYPNAGIDLYNETTGVIEVELDLPSSIESAHALAYDGEFLWLGGIGENESLYKLNPLTGDVISEIPNIRTEGIAVDGNNLYYSVYETNTINKIEKNGTFIETITPRNIAPEHSIPDIAIDGGNLYYLRYLSFTETAPVVKLNLSSNNEVFIDIGESIDTYCLAIFNNEIVAVTLLNNISRFDKNSGDFISSNLVHEDIENAWITAIAPHYEIIEAEE